MAVRPKTRFEVFKRDSFTCQYCGKKAPDVVLHCDHIHPVKEGGTDDILNLVTACVGCNLGKGARLLNDSTVVEKQREQLEEMQSKREQLKMMNQWRLDLLESENEAANIAAGEWRRMAIDGPNASGCARLKQLIGNYGFAAVVDAMRISAQRYITINDDGTISDWVWSRAFDKIGGICYLRKKRGEEGCS